MVLLNRSIVPADFRCKGVVCGFLLFFSMLRSWRNSLATAKIKFYPRLEWTYKGFQISTFIVSFILSCCRNVFARHRVWVGPIFEIIHNYKDIFVVYGYLWKRTQDVEGDALEWRSYFIPVKFRTSMCVCTVSSSPGNNIKAPFLHIFSYLASAV